MRPGQQNKRGRGRNNNGGGGGGQNFNRKGANPLTRTFDSSGPDVKIRGTAQHIAEKYSALARDAQSSGDRVMAENYLQHAEHYNRIIAAAQAQMQERFQRDDRADGHDRDYNDRDEDMDGGDDQPVVTTSRPAPEPAPRHQPAPVVQSQPAAEERQPEPAVAQDPATAEQPSVEGDGEAKAEGRQPRRRSATPRPRRQPRRAAGSDDNEGGQGGGDEASAALATAASE